MSELLFRSENQRGAAVKSVRLGCGRTGFESPHLYQKSLLGDLGTVTHAQPNLPHRAIVRTTRRRGE